MLSKHKDLNKNCFSKNANASKDLAQNLTKLQVYCVCCLGKLTSGWHPEYHFKKKSNVKIKCSNNNKKIYSFLFLPKIIKKNYWQEQ